MKKLFPLIVLFTSIFGSVHGQNIAVNTTGAAAATANMFEVTQASTTNNTVGIFSTHTGAATNAYAIWAAVTGATNKYAIVVPSGGGFTGLGTSSPVTQLHVASKSISNAHYGLLVDAVIQGQEGRLQIIGEEQSWGSACLILTNAFGAADNRHWVMHHRAAAAAPFANPGNSLNFSYISTTATGQDVFSSSSSDIKMAITNTGNIGIGTADPNVKLHVFSSADDQPEIKVENTNATGLNAIGVLRAAADAANIFMASHGSARTLTRYGIALGGYSEITNWNSGNGLIIGTQLNKPVIFGSNNLERMRIDGSGNVGIGTTSPSVPLNVVFTQNSPITPGIIFTNNGTGHSSTLGLNAGSTGNPALTYQVSGITKGGISWEVAGNYIGMVNLLYSTSTFSNRLNSDGSFTFNDGANGAERVRFTAAGNVGISISAPITKLDLGLASNNKPVFRLSPGTATAVDYNVSGYYHNDWLQGSYVTGGYSQHYISFGYTTDVNRKFHIGSASNSLFDATTTFVPAFTITSGGSVGIGTTAPGYKLQVGTAADGTEARANAWNTLSDKRLKKDFTVLPNALDKVMQLNGYYYYWNTGIDKRKQFGVISQEVRTVLPEITSVDAEGYISVDYSKLTPLLINAIKEQQQKIDELTTKVASLDAALKSAGIQTSADKK